jgi:hypothetical protein
MIYGVLREIEFEITEFVSHYSTNQGKWGEKEALFDRERS